MTLVKFNRPTTKTVDGLINDFFNEWPFRTQQSTANVPAFPPVNITEKENSYLLEMAIPGLEKQDFNIRLDNNLLTISTDKKGETSASSDKNIRQEYRFQAFKRSFTLDEKVDGTGISARYENGILKLDIPKKETEKSSSQQISVE